MFLALHIAMAYDKTNQYSIEKSDSDTQSEDNTQADGNTQVDKKFDYMFFFDEFKTEIEEAPMEIYFTESTPKCMLGAIFACLIGIGYVISSKKKFINGQEYGSSQWGILKQIKHLSSKEIEKNDLKEIKKKKISHLKKVKSIEENKEKYKNSDIIFTQTEKICMYNRELNNNTMIIGGSGSGKTRGYVLPNILQCAKGKYSPSLVITDPKGEILGKVGKYLLDSGYEIKVLNLKEQNRSFCFNPFKYILPHKYEESISSLVSSIMDSNDVKEKKANDPFWEDMSKVLLKSIFYAVYEGFKIEERNMQTVMEMFRWFEVSDHDNRYTNPTKLDKFFNVFGDKDGTLDVANDILNFYDRYYLEFVKEIGLKSSLPLVIKEIQEKIAIQINSSDSDGIMEYRNEIGQIVGEIREVVEDENAKIFILANRAIKSIEKYIDDRFYNYRNNVRPIGVTICEKYGDVNSNPALRNWEDFRTKCKGKTAQSVTATALAKLSPFDEEQIRRIFSKDQMELDLIGEKKIALFIVLPPTNRTYNFIANVLYTQLFEQLEYCATVKHNQQLPIPVRFILDEFFNTGRIPNFENILSYARSFGIGISIILQSLDQIKEMYEKSWGTVLDNCSTFLYLGGIRHADTLEYISKLLGKGTFDKKTYSRTKGRQSSTSTNFDKIGRELLDSSEIQRLNKNKCLLFINGYNPFISKKFNYKTHKNYKKTADYDIKNLYKYELPKENIQENPHGEEKKTIDIVRTEEITMNDDINEGVESIKNNLMNVEIDESLINDIDDDVAIDKIIKEEKELNENLNTLIKSKLIELKTNGEDVSKTLNELEENKEDVEYDSNMEEKTIDEVLQDDIEYKDDTDTMTDLDDVEFAICELKNEMLDEGFMDDLSNINIDELPNIETEHINN